MALVKSKTNWKDKTVVWTRVIWLPGDGRQQRKANRWERRAEAVGEVPTSHNPTFLCEVGCTPSPI